MNNSKIAIHNQEEPEDRTESLQKQKGELSLIVEAINRVEQSNDWQKLKELVLDGVVSSLERSLANEANGKELNLPEIYRLQGQLRWAKKYADLKKLADYYKLQIEGIKNLIK